MSAVCHRVHIGSKDFTRRSSIDSVKDDVLVKASINRPRIVQEGS